MLQFFVKRMSARSATGSEREQGAKLFISRLSVVSSLLSFSVFCKRQHPVCLYQGACYHGI
jgi:hypothetical protein